jgi:hypothetical protein
LFWLSGDERLFSAVAFVHIDEVPSVMLVSTFGVLALGSLLVTVVAAVKTARGTLAPRGKFPFFLPLAATVRSEGQYREDVDTDGNQGGKQRQDAA